MNNPLVSIIIPNYNHSLFLDERIQSVLNQTYQNFELIIRDKIMLRKRCIIETINDMLKNTAQLVHSRHRSVNNFIMNMVASLAAYCFFDNKPQALDGYYIEDTKQLMLF